MSNHYIIYIIYNFRAEIQGCSVSLKILVSLKVNYFYRQARRVCSY